MSTIVITQLNIYPIKSCGRVTRKSAELDDRGFALDRRWMIVDPTGRFLTQRELPRLSLIGIELQSDGIRVHASGMPDFRLPYRAPEGAPARVVVWDDEVRAVDAGQEASDWCSKFLGTPVRVVQMNDASDRLATMGQHESHVTFADAYPLLLISEGSLHDLNARMSIPLPMDRFRSNIVVEGCEPYAEDRFGEIRTMA